MLNTHLSYTILCINIMVKLIVQVWKTAKDLMHLYKRIKPDNEQDSIELKIKKPSKLLTRYWLRIVEV